MRYLEVPKKLKLEGLVAILRVKCEHYTIKCDQRQPLSKLLHWLQLEICRHPMQGTNVAIPCICSQPDTNQSIINEDKSFTKDQFTAKMTKVTYLQNLYIQYQNKI